MSYEDDPFLLYRPISIICTLCGFQQVSRPFYLTTATISFFLYVIIVCMSLFTTSTVGLPPEHARVIQMDTWILCAYTTVVFHVLAFYYRNRTTVVGLLRGLKDFDEAVEELLHVEFSSRGRGKKWTCSMVVCFGVIVTVGTVTVVYEESKWRFIGRGMINCLQYTVALQYTFLLSQLLLRLGFLNDCVGSFEDHNYCLSKRRLRLFKILHEHLRTVASTMDATFGAFQAHIAICTYAEHVLEHFGVFLVLKSEATDSGLLAQLVVNWAIKMAFQLLPVFAFAHKVTEEVSGLWR